jgi:hypothetical protein
VLFVCARLPSDFSTSAGAAGTGWTFFKLDRKAWVGNKVWRSRSRDAETAKAQQMFVLITESPSLKLCTLIRKKYTFVECGAYLWQCSTLRKKFLRS